jgi:hypothetical protein
MSYCPECNSLHFDDSESHFASGFDGAEVSRFDGDSAENTARFYGAWDHNYSRGGGAYTNQGGITTGYGQQQKRPPQKTMRAYFDGLAPGSRSRRSRFYAEPQSEGFFDSLTSAGNAVADAWHKVWN